MVVSLDKGMNRVLQDEKMHVNIRYWDDIKGQLQKELYRCGLIILKSLSTGEFVQE